MERKEEIKIMLGHLGTRIKHTAHFDTNSDVSNMSNVQRVIELSKQLEKYYIELESLPK